MTRKLTCFLASIGPWQTPITILSLASSAAACHEHRSFLYMFLEKVNTLFLYMFLDLEEMGTERKSTLLIYYKLVINKQKEGNESCVLPCRLNYQQEQTGAKGRIN